VPGTETIYRPNALAPRWLITAASGLDVEIGCDAATPAACNDESKSSAAEPLVYARQLSQLAGAQCLSGGGLIRLLYCVLVPIARIINCSPQGGRGGMKRLQAWLKAHGEFVGLFADANTSAKVPLSLADIECVLRFQQGRLR
jgi:hypothetical protein